VPELHVEEAGAGPSIVFVHDGLLHRQTWDAQFEAFARRYRVIRWDRRGYGLSDPAREPYSSLDDLVSIVERSGPATVVGCSYGALLSVHCALDRPDLVTGLVLVAPIISGLRFSEHFRTRGRRLTRADLSLAEEIEYLSRTDPWFVAPGNEAARDRVRDLLTANPHNLEPKAALERQPEPPALPRLGEIEVPTLILVGESDIADVHAHAGAIEAGIRYTLRVVLTRCGHLPQLERPEAFNQVVLEFLDASGR
jgi:pimeloyl-ACP methyl ester carboxylesterase